MHNDHLGSIGVGTDGNTGSVLWEERYTPYGEALIAAAANDNQGGFTGHIKDAATGLNYMQARYYDPVGARLLSVDPVGFMDAGSPSYFNRYRYCSNDTVNCTDPTGTADWIPNIFSEMFQEESSQALTNYVENSMPDGAQTDTGDPYAGPTGPMNPSGGMDAIAAGGGAAMASMDGLVEAFVQTTVMGASLATPVDEALVGAAGAVKVGTRVGKNIRMARVVNTARPRSATQNTQGFTQQVGRANSEGQFFALTNPSSGPMPAAVARGPGGSLVTTGSSTSSSRVGTTVNMTGGAAATGVRTCDDNC